MYHGALATRRTPPLSAWLARSLLPWGPAVVAMAATGPCTWSRIKPRIARSRAANQSQLGGRSELAERASGCLGQAHPGAHRPPAPSGQV